MALPVGLALAALVAPAASNVSEARLELRGAEFVVRNAGRTERVPLRAAAEPKPAVWPERRLVFRKDDAYAVWDSRGMSVRQGKWIFTTRLPEIPTTPKLFARDEILFTKGLVEQGRRKVEADGVAGALRDGKRVYWLVRWSEKTGSADLVPWLEALVLVNLESEKPKPQLLGRFEGLSLDLRSGQSRLFIRDGKPSAWVKTPEAWGLAQYDPDAKQFSFRPVGGMPELVEKLSDRFGWSLERTPHGTRILSRWDAQSLARRELLETKGTARLLDAETPWIAIVHDEEDSYLQNLETGAKVRLPANPSARRTALGVLLWSPASRPDRAYLYDPAHWKRLAEWSGKG
jgi:hypothetical protein